MDELIISKEEIEKWTEKLKKILDVNSEKRVAEELDISPSQYSQMKNNGKFHFEKFITFMRKRNLSLDDFFNIKDSASDENILKCRIPYYKDNKKYILLQSFDNSLDELRVIAKDEQYIIFNTSIKEFTTDGIYVFKQGDFIIVRKIKFHINVLDIEKIELEFIDINNEEDRKTISIENLSKINIIGKVESIIQKIDIK